MGVAKFSKLWEEGWLKKQLETKRTRTVAKEVGCSHGGVMYAVRTLGIEIPERLHYESIVDKSQIMKDALKRLYPNGRFGEQSNHWKGGRAKAGNGKYIYIHSPDHPFRTKDNYVMEHRLVMEKFHGRFLEPWEFVHHLNGDRKDNRPENLEIATKRQHARRHFDDCKRVVELESELSKYKEKYGAL
jgi:hypothetical protein